MLESHALLPAEIDRLKVLVETLPDERSVYEAIGASLGPAASGEGPIARGKRAVARHLETLRDSLCGNSALKAFSTGEDAADATDLAIAVAGVLVTTKIAGLDQLLIACLVSRIGLRRLCDDEWT